MMKKLLFILFIVFLVSACQDNIEVIEEDTQEETTKETTEEVTEKMAAGDTKEEAKEETPEEEPAEMDGITGAYIGGSSGGKTEKEQSQPHITPQQLMQASAPTPVCDMATYNECMQSTSTGSCLGNCPIISVPCQGSTASLGCFEIDPACEDACEQTKQDNCNSISNC